MNGLHEVIEALYHAHEIVGCCAGEFQVLQESITMSELQIMQISDYAEKGDKNEGLTGLSLFNLVDLQIFVEEVDLNVDQRKNVFTKSSEQ